MVDRISRPRRSTDPPPCSGVTPPHRPRPRHVHTGHAQGRPAAVVEHRFPLVSLQVGRLFWFSVYEYRENRGIPRAGRRPEPAISAECSSETTYFG